MERSAKSAKSRQSDKKKIEGRGQTKRGRGADNDGWGGFRNYMDAKKYKLDDQFDQDNKGRTSEIFAGVYIYVNGYTKPSSDELRRIMQKHGGRYETYLSKTRVTHIVASNLPNSKFKMARTMPIVKPAWIIDSVSAGRRLSHVPYLLLGNQSKLQPGLKSFPSVSSLHKSSSTASATSLYDAVPSTSASMAVTDNLHSKNSADGKRICDGGNEFNVDVQINGRDPESTNLPGKNCNRVLETNDVACHAINKLSCGEEGKTPKLNSQQTDIKDNLKPDCDGFHEAVRKHVDCVNVSDEEIVYNSDCGDDNDVVYNSDENPKDGFGFHTTTSSGGKTLGNIGQNPLKRSRVYSLRKHKLSKSGSFDSVRSDTSSCDGFSECLQIELPASTHVTPVSNASVNKIIPSSVNVLEKTDTINTNVSKDQQRPPSASSPATLDQSPTVHTQEHPNDATFIHAFNPAEALKPVASVNCKLKEATALVQQATSDVSKYGENSMLNKTTENTHCTAQSVKVKDVAKSASILSPKKSTIAREQPSSSPRKETSMMAKAGDKGFLEEFYSNSRLHHLSTWGAEFKAYVSEIQRTGNASFPGREKLRQVHIEAITRAGLVETLDSCRHTVSTRVIMHIDMDCFFVSVGLLSRPDLKGKPVAVTHSKGQGSKPNSSSNLAWEQAEWRKMRDGKLKGESRAQAAIEFDGDDDKDFDDQRKGGYDFMVPKGSTGVQTFHSMAEIASCSYEARKAGVKNGMFMGRAMSLCPDLQTIPYNFTEYNRISKILYDLVASYTHDIEAVSCDEMLIDCTDVLTDTGATAMEFARLLRSEMMEKTGCPASTGIGPNVLLAKLATRRAKPNGQFEVQNSEAKQFIQDQPVSDLPGVGYSMTRKLSKLDVQTCGQLQHVPVSTLRREFGPKTGEGLHKYSFGQDDRPVKGDKQRKSVSAEVNYGIRFSKDLDALTFLKELADEVKRRLDGIQVKGRCITLKLMVRRPDAPPETAKFMGHGICNTFNKSSNLPVATNDEDLIAREVISLYKSQKVIAEDVRGIGIQINKLESSSSNPRGLTSIKGHQSILNFAVPSCSKINPGQNFSGEGSKPKSAGLTHQGDAGAVPIEAAMKPTKQGTSTQGRSSRNFSPSLFSSMSSSSSSSSSSTKFTAMKNQSVPHGKAETEKNSSISSALSTSLANSNAVHDEAALVLSASNSFGESKRNASPAPCFEVSSASTRSSLGSTEHAQREQPSSSNEMLLFLDRPGPSTDQSNQIAMPGPSSRRSDHQSEEFTYLSLSQIDSDILKELPEDIAQEIVAGLTLQRQQRGRPNREEADRHANIQDSDRRQTRAHNDVQDEPALPSLSQLNMSCFEALPTHLQEEIRAEYAWQKKKATEKNHQNVGENYFTRLTSPRKEHKNKGTGQRGRRGRPPGKKKLSFPGNRAKNSDILKQTSKVAFIDFPGIIVCDDEDENTNDGNNFKDQENSRDCSDIIPVPQRVHKHNVQGNLYSEPHKKVEPASLCGAVTLLDVRMLIKEWLSSGPEPQSEDLTLVTEYLTRLLEQRKLDLVFSLLKLIYRNSIMSEHHSWRDCLQNLVNLIQSLMCASYGACFKL